MNLNQYQAAAWNVSTVKLEGQTVTAPYAALGIAAEAGELANLVKKEWRATGDVSAPVPAWARERMIEELGDVLWYTAHLASVLGVTLEEVAAGNIRKLDRRLAAAALGVAR